MSKDASKAIAYRILSLKAALTQMEKYASSDSVEQIKNEFAARIDELESMLEYLTEELE